MVRTKLKTKGEKVLKEFAKGTLKSSSGATVKRREQALAIAFSEQERADKASTKAKKHRRTRRSRRRTRAA